MTIIYYLIIAIFAAAMLYGSWIAAGHDGEKENLIQYNYNDNRKEDNEK